jgi:hypothetical protein
MGAWSPDQAHCFFSVFCICVPFGLNEKVAFCDFFSRCQVRRSCKEIKTNFVSFKRQNAVFATETGPGNSDFDDVVSEFSGSFQNVLPVMVNLGEIVAHLLSPLSMGI